MKKILIFTTIAAILLIAGNLFIYFEKIKKYTSKKHWAVCSNIYGMVTYDIILNNDYTFYTKIFGRYYFGEYNIKNNNIYFTNFEEINICKAYIFKDSEHLIPINCESYHEELIFRVERE